MLRTKASCIHCSKQISLSNIRLHEIACIARIEKAARKCEDVTRRSRAQQKVDPEIRKERARKAAAATHTRRREARDQRIVQGAWDELSHTERRERLLVEQCSRCAMCDIEQEWNGYPLKFELDHISGIRTDESRNNLRLVCPNCHSQTPTYKSKNRSNGKTYSDEEIIEALINSESVYKALVKLGMNPHGGNYVRIRRIVKNYGIMLPYQLI